MKRLPIALAILFVALPAYSQNTIIFTAETTTAIGEVTPVLTWDTLPLADDCTASGNWSGQKGGAGSETLPTINSSATYSLACQWIDDMATLTWSAPTENTDGSPLTDLAGFKIYYHTQPVPPADIVIDLNDPNLTTHLVVGLAAGSYHFRATAYNTAGIESDLSSEAVKTVTGSAGQSEAISIVVNPQPNAPAGFTVN